VAMTTSLYEAQLYFIHENAKALQVLTKEKGVTMFDAPADYSPAWIAASKKVLGALEAQDPFFKKVLDSQRAFAKVVVPYTRETSKLSTLIAGAAEGN
jgi:TRAP-type mannitol/chloroaromatic compound transport system substrate-binding protein